MIWSFIKIVLFVAIVSALTLGAGYLAQTGSGVRISIGTMEFSLGPVQMVVGVLVALLGLWLLLKLAGLIVAVMRFINGDETAFSRYFDRNRERKGFQALSEGLMAIASGEGKVAMAKAAKAEKYLSRPELTNLVSAQAAELAGDTKRATEVYKRLLAEDRTRFIGVRGLMRQKLSEGDTDTALKLAEKAFALKPRHREVQDTLMRLQAEKGDWKGARSTLQVKHSQGELPRDVYKRRDAVLALQEAKEVFSDGASIEAREKAIAANKQSPDLIPAAVLAARGYIQAGKPKYAARVLKKAWAAQPHPDLAATFAAIEPGESPAARLRRFDQLIGANAAHEESRLLKAELHIAAEEFPQARRAIGTLTETHPTARSLTIMAAIARGEGQEDRVVRGWLTRALTAGRGPQWICDKCQHIQTDWAPTCENCGGFDTLAWREPPNTATPMPNGAEMLPLIVGPAPEPEPESEPPIDVVATDPTDESGIIDEGVGKPS